MILFGKISRFLVALILIIGIPFGIGYCFEPHISKDVEGSISIYTWLAIYSWTRGILYFAIPIIGGALLVMMFKFIWTVVNDQQKN